MTFSPRFIAWRWATFATLLLGYVGYYLCRANLQAVQPTLGTSLGYTMTEIGLIGTVSTAAYGAGKFTHGFLADKFGGKVMFLIGIFGAALFSAAFGMASSLGAFVVLWSLNRFVQAGGWVGMVQICAQWYPRNRLGTYMSVLSLSYLAGDWAARQLAGALIAASFDWRMVFYIPAGLAALIGLTAIFTVKASPEAIAEPTLSVESAGETREGGFEWALVLELFRGRAFRTLCVLSVLLTGIRVSFQEWSSLYLQVIGNDPANAMKDSSIFSLAGIVSTILAGIISDRFFGGRRGPVCIACLAVMCIGLFGLALDASPTPDRAYAYLGLVGFGLLGPFSLLGGAGSIDVGGRKMAATAAGLVDGVGYIVAPALGSLGIASVVERYGWSNAFGLLAVAGVCSVATTAVMARR